MPETHVRIDFDELTQIAANFSQSAADTGQLTQEIGQTVVKLYDGDWEGRGAQAFYAEAADTLFPAMERLSDALQNAGEASHQIIRLMQEAEERAAREFDGGGGGIPGRGRHQSGNPTGIGKITDIKWNPVKNAEPFVSDPNHPGEPAIHPNDVKQGQIADCFVVSPLAALAQNNPDLIKRAIRKNDDGSYTVTLYKEKTILGIGTGKYEPVEIRVENDFPSGKRDWGNGKVAEVNAHAQVGDVGEDGKTEIWPLLMEKAYAKLQSGGLDLKGYQAISNNGVSGDALSAFTGQKSEYHDKPQDIKLDDLAKMHQSGQSILLGTPQSTENGKYGAPSDKKLVYNHSYYVTNVDAAKGTVTIRNPHGWEKGEITIPYNELNKYFWSITANKSGK